MIEVKLEASWKEILKAEFSKEYFIRLTEFIRQEKDSGKSIYPPGPLIFNAFQKTPANQLKVVILGQDPYHGPNEAMGLSFSVPKGISIPPSLLNIYKEIQREFGYPVPSHGDLSSWAEQGVLLLNATLTVVHKTPNAHKNSGWQIFTDQVIQAISKEKRNIVFLLWGNFARSKKLLIDAEKHLILESPHPSPLAGGGFFGNDHFLQANAYLTSKGLKPIEWKIPEP